MAGVLAGGKAVGVLASRRGAGYHAGGETLGPRAMTQTPWLTAYPVNIDWRAEIPIKAVSAILGDSATRFPSHACIDFFGRKYTYSEVAALVDRAARGFQKMGVAKGTRAGLFLPNCPQFIVAYYGILKAGGTVVNYSPLYAEGQLRHQIEDSETSLMVTLDLQALYPKLVPLVGTTPLRRLVVGTMQEALPWPKRLLFPLVRRKDIARRHGGASETAFADLLRDDRPPAAVDIDPETDIAVLQYTGGTTGTPKGAMLTHANLYANATQARMWLEGVEWGGERMMGVLPFFHVFAMTVVMNLALLIGAEIILRPRFELDAVLNDIHHKRPTLVPGVPTMYAAINTSLRLRELDLTSIKYCISGGAPLPLEVKERFEGLTFCKLVEGYGLTETSPVAACNPLGGGNKAGSIGQPLPGTTVAIMDPEDPARELPLGERGEICIAGPQVMAGYWRRPDETAQSIFEGRVRTGDIGTMDEEGYVFLVDRINDLILVSGFNVYPRTIEEALYEHEAVLECIVVGVPDDLKGQAVKAFIKLQDGASPTADDLLAFLRPRVSKHELPREIEFRDVLPKTLVGKLSKKGLFEEELERYRVSKRTAI